MPDLPTGTVTFLFTDIEGSITRWEHHRDAMRVAIARHHALLRQVITAHNGFVFKMMGDVVYAVFAVAADAVAAALAAQQAVAAEERTSVQARTSEGQQKAAGALRLCVALLSMSNQLLPSAPNWVRRSLLTRRQRDDQCRWSKPFTMHSRWMARR